MARECVASLPSLRGEPGDEFAAVTPPSRKHAVEALLDSVEEVVASREPVVVVIVGEWGEGKTWAWRAYVKPALAEKGVNVLEVRASTLYEVMRRASWIASPAWRLVTSILVAATILESIPGDYRRVVSEKVRSRAVVFIDEVEDLAYHGEALNEFLEALHALLDGEAGAPTVSIYASISPAAYAKLTTWPSWRRLRRRIRIVELKPVTRGEALEALREMFVRSVGSIPLEDPRLLNAIVEASKGNLGALAAYARRVLAAFARRGCSKPLAVDDVLRILAEPLPAGLLEAGLDVKRLGEVAGGRKGVEKALLLIVLGGDEIAGVEDLVEPVPACKPVVLDDRIYVTRDGSLVALGGIVEEYLVEIGGAIGGRCESKDKLYVVKPELVGKVYGGHPSLASFIRDESLRRRAVREAYHSPGFAARGLAVLMCMAGYCRYCELLDKGGVVEVNVNGLWVRVSVVADSGDATIISARKPHVLLYLGGVERGSSVYPKVVGLKLDPVTQIQLAALGYVAKSCRDAPVDMERVNVLWALLDSRYHVLDRVVEALREEPPLLIPWIPLHFGKDKLVYVLRLLALHYEARPREIAETASHLKLPLSNAEIEAVLHHLARHGVVERDGERFRLTISPPERSVLELLRLLGGRCRVSELAERLVEERIGALNTWLRVLNAKGFIDAPRRITGRSIVRLIPLEELRSSASSVINKIPVELRVERQCVTEVCERGWLAAITWIAEIASRSVVEAGSRVSAEKPPVQHLGLPFLEAGSSAEAHATTSVESREARSPEIRLFEKKLVELLRKAPLALAEGRLEELASTIAHAKRVASKGRVRDAIMLLDDMLSTISRSPDTGLVVVARALDPSIASILELLEDSGVARRVLEKLVARKAGSLVGMGLLYTEARIVNSARLS